MITLSETNRAVGTARQVFHVSLIIPITMGLMAWGLAAGAAPRLKFGENFLEMTGFAIVVLCLAAFPLSYCLKWNWSARHYGASIFPFATVSLLNLYPVLCILTYGNLPWAISCAIGFFVAIFIMTWCLRVIKVYRKIYSSKSLFDSIYVEKRDAVYFLLQEDKKIVEKIIKFDFSPSTGIFLIFGFAAASTIPFASLLSSYVGVPYIHIFLAVGSFPIAPMIIGVFVEGWLVFYHYPYKIKKIAKKGVYVDISSSTKKILDEERSIN